MEPLTSSFGSVHDWDLIRWLMLKHLWIGWVVLIASCSDDGTPWQGNEVSTTSTDSVGHTDDDDDDDDNEGGVTGTSGGVITGTSLGTESVGTAGPTSTGDDTGEVSTTGIDTGDVDDSGSSTSGSETGSEGSSGESSTGDPVDDGYCPGVEPWPSDALLCERAEDCPDDWECSPTGELPTSCGACTAPEHPCTGDETCSDGEVCEPFDEPCACDGALSGCVAPCQDGDCGDGETCRDDGHCTPQSCVDEWSCGDGTHCEPLADSADEHGCTPIACDAGWSCQDPQVCVSSEEGGGCQDVTCEDAADCVCGSCVEGICRSAPGVCIPPPPPVSRLSRSSR